MIGYHRLPLLCGAVAGPLFTAAYLAQGATRAPTTRCAIR